MERLPLEQRSGADNQLRAARDSRSPKGCNATVIGIKLQASSLMLSSLIRRGEPAVAIFAVSTGDQISSPSDQRGDETMPSPRAYSEPQVIATGVELEKSGPVTAKLLHEALGGRGDRYTAFGAWQAFTDHRQHLAGIPQKVEAAGYSPAMAEFVTQIEKLTTAMATQVQTETAEPLERRAGYLLHGLDELLAERSALRAENDDLRDALNQATPAAPIVHDTAPSRASLLILPDGPRRPPRERFAISTPCSADKR